MPNVRRRTTILITAMLILVAGSLLYLTIYAAGLARDTQRLRSQHLRLVRHGLALTDNIENIRRSLHHLDRTSVAFNQSIDETLPKTWDLVTITEEDETDRALAQALSDSEFQYLRPAYQNLSAIMNHLLNSSDNIRLGKVRADSIPSMLPTLGRVNSRFGMRDSPVTGLKRKHKGLDIAADLGTTVHAAANGVVGSARKNGRYGKLLTLNHAYGFKTRYAHLKGFLVKKGERVVRGQPVALVGNTGRSTGAHLHFEVLLRGHHIDPLPFISRNGIEIFSAEEDLAEGPEAVVKTPKDLGVEMHGAFPVSLPNPILLSWSFFLGLLISGFLLFALFYAKVFLVQRFFLRKRKKAEAQWPASPDPVRYWST